MKNKEIDTKLREYYQECELFLPNKPQWRYFIFRLPDKSFKRFHIANEKELRHLLIKYTPLLVYYSSSAFLNSQNVRGVKSSSYPILIFEDLILDIDNDKSLAHARKSALEIIKRIGEPDYILITRRGFHLCYYKKGDKKKEILDKLRDIEDLDFHTIENEFGVYTLPYTPTKDGKKSTILNNIPLELSIKTLRKLQKKIYTPTITPEKPEKRANEKAGKQLEELPEGRSKQEIKQEKGTESGVTVLSFSNLIKNDLFIPILIYDKSLRGLKRELNYLVEQYDLGDLFMFKNETHFCFVSLRVMDKRRLEKLLNSSRSITKTQQKKFKKTWLNFSEWKPLIKITTTPNKFFRASKKHYEALIKMGFNKSKEINEFVEAMPLKVFEVGMS